jgi:NADH:ubiquinone oxidoreductase subunit K
MDFRIRNALGVMPLLTCIVYFITIYLGLLDSKPIVVLIMLSLLCVSLGFTVVMFSRKHIQHSTLDDAIQAAFILGIKILVIACALCLAAVIYFFWGAHA